MIEESKITLTIPVSEDQAREQKKDNFGIFNAFSFISLNCESA